MAKKFVKDIVVKNKLVFLRNDFNVPLNKKREITDDNRIRESLATFRFLLDQGARIVCCSHLGRPKGEIIPECSLKPVADRLSELVGREVLFNGEIVGAKAEQARAKLKPGQILLLENLRFHPGETANDESFARELAKGVDVFVDDAFGACHRAHASIAAITRFVPVAACGFLLKKEIDFLSLALHNPPANFLLILGGAKVADKIPVITNLLDHGARTILIGGAMAYTFLKARGEEVGNSRVESEFLPVCTEIMKKAETLGRRLLLPIDHVSAIKIEPHITIKFNRPGEPIAPEMMGLDIGPETIELYSQEIAKAELIVWNGPMGVFEFDTFAAGTIEIARAIAAAKATSIVGGGDSVAALSKAKVADRISHISTGGGAALEFLSGEKLPGIEALTEA